MMLFLIFPIWAIGAIIGFPCIVIYAIHRCCSKEKHNEDVEGGQPNRTEPTTLPFSPRHENISFLYEKTTSNKRNKSHTNTVDSHRRGPVPDISRIQTPAVAHHRIEKDYFGYRQDPCSSVELQTLNYISNRTNSPQSEYQFDSTDNRGRAVSRRNVQNHDSESDERNDIKRSKSSGISANNRGHKTKHHKRGRNHSCPERRNIVFPGQRIYTELEVTKTGKLINLHGMSRQDALSETEKYLKQTVQEYINSGYLRINRFFWIVTGQGNHSKEPGKPVIKPEVEKFLNNHLFIYNIPPKNPGVIVVDFWKSKDSHYF